jgi:hypothetical protein
VSAEGDRYSPGGARFVYYVSVGDVRGGGVSYRQHAQHQVFGQPVIFGDGDSLDRRRRTAVADDDAPKNHVFLLRGDHRLAVQDVLSGLAVLQY